ncbi:MAG TPA: PA3611 family quorum-sensing-regulated virulence factor [Aliidongia sp.]|uniref:PA3611 family quorum-sensing-regulated virulence factor n=1 Tax=Aliidongia sp. TaxID=1914230 RepID=UPI002DDD3E47|nr:PA3611 family quorum-sensing-regulated virulence factor [Aliidongia sp.]HEV2675934.1 PA3611 family quorum-sensing-regulated virulence factor [Aliidongia sp.]
MKLPTGMPERRFLQASVFLLIAPLIVIPAAHAQNAPDVNTMPLDQLAGAIAHTIETGTARSPGAPITFNGTTVQGTKVVIHFAVKDSALLAKLKAGSDHIREEMASHTCRNPQSATPLKRGISLIDLYELDDKSDKLEITIDAAACDSLAHVTPASASELSQLASQVVNKLRSDEEKTQQTQGGVNLKQLEAKDGIVEERYIVVTPAFESFYRANIPQTQAMIKGSVCFKFGDSVRRGLRLHLVYEQIETGVTLSDFNIGPSDC